MARKCLQTLTSEDEKETVMMVVPDADELMNKEICY